jgi:phosphate-selective porin OprO/OprP
LTSGALKTKRDLSWKLGFMYDGNEKTWFLRETGLTIGVPEVFGHILSGAPKKAIRW